MLNKDTPPVRKVMPEANWICADILDLPDQVDQLGGTFDCAISNPPFGSVPTAPERTRLRRAPA